MHVHMYWNSTETWQAQFLYAFMYQLKVNLIKSLNSLSCIYMYQCDILFLMSRQETDCSPGASWLINYSLSRIFLASNEYLIFGSKPDPLWVNNILKDTHGTVGTSVVCERGGFTLQVALGWWWRLEAHTPEQSLCSLPQLPFSGFLAGIGLLPLHWMFTSVRLPNSLGTSLGSLVPMTAESCQTAKTR